MLKYTPEHMHCLATIYGALAPPNTGVLAIQTSTGNQQVSHWLCCNTHVDPTLRLNEFVVTKITSSFVPLVALCPLEDTLNSYHVLC